MDLKIINPREYPDWDALLLRNHNHSFFHSSGWAQVLEKSYGYKPIYFTLIEAGQLAFLMPLMEVRSRLTGKRAVSLPFTDRCAPYAPKHELLKSAVNYAIDLGVKSSWKFLELRDAGYVAHDVIPSEVYYTHDIELLKTEEDLFARLRDANQRNIRKAGREGICIKIDQSLDSVKSFYRLNCITRKRHGLPPQPFAFFNNVFVHIISKGLGIVISAYYSKEITASSVFFHFGSKAIFKYGASEMKHQNLRPNNLIMWEAIKWYKNHGVEELNLGRTEPQNQGLLQYKRTWGATERFLRYYRYDFRKKSFLQNKPRPQNIFIGNSILARMPTSLLRIMGSLTYKYLG